MSDNGEDKIRLVFGEGGAGGYLKLERPVPFSSVSETDAESILETGFANLVLSVFFFTMGSRIGSSFFNDLYLHSSDVRVYFVLSLFLVS